MPEPSPNARQVEQSAGEELTDFVSPQTAVPEPHRSWLLAAFATTGIAMGAVPILFNLVALVLLFIYRSKQRRAGLPLDRRYRLFVWMNIGWLLLITTVIVGGVWIGIEVLDPRGSLHEYQDYWPEVLTPPAR